MVVVERLGGDLGQADAADPRRRLVEVAVDELLVQPDRLEDLGTSIALDRADAHLGHHLDDPFLDRLAIAVNRLVVVDPGDQPLADHVVERLERHVRVDRARTVAQQEGEVVDLACVAAFDDQAGRGAQPSADHLDDASPEHASSDGIGAMSAFTPRSERMIRFTPCSIAWQARSKRPEVRFQAPAPLRRPRTAWARLTDLNPRQPSSCLSRASSSLSRIGRSSAICRHASGVGSSRLPSPPAPVKTDVTSSSRMASSGGFVT